MEKICIWFDEKNEESILKVLNECFEDIYVLSKEHYINEWFDLNTETFTNACLIKFITNINDFNIRKLTDILNKQTYESMIIMPKD